MSQQACTTIDADAFAELTEPFLPWALLVAGSAASLAANVAVAEPTATGRVIAAWPSFALIASYELLMRQVRSAADVGATHRPRPQSRAAAVPPSTAAASVPRPTQLPETVRRSAGRQAQADAWQWAVANRDVDGSLPSGKDIGVHHDRHERWRRLVKTSGLAGELDPQA
jgi:hypothetical protein